MLIYGYGSNNGMDLSAVIPSYWEGILKWPGLDRGYGTPGPRYVSGPYILSRGHIHVYIFVFKGYIYIYVNIHDSWYTYYAKPPYVLCKNKGSINHHENGLVTPDWVPPTWPWRDHSAVAALRRASRWRSVCVPVGARTSQMHPGCRAWNILVRLKNVP